MTDRGPYYELMNQNEKETDNNEQTTYKKSTEGSIDEELTVIEEREIPGDATRRRDGCFDGEQDPNRDSGTESSKTQYPLQERPIAAKISTKILYIERKRRRIVQER